MDNKQRISLRLQTQLGCSARSADRAVQEFYNTLCRNLLRYNQYYDGHYYIRMEELIPIRISAQRKSYRVNTLIESMPETPYVVINRGSNLSQRLTQIDLKMHLQQLLDSVDAEQQALKLYAPHQQAFNEGEYDEVPIDQTSLRAYMQDAHNRLNALNTISLPSNKQAAKIRRITQNLNTAIVIHNCSRVNGDCLIQIRSASDYGRTYYTGINLQNTSRMVREAALGSGYAYDLESSVFAWKLSLFREISTLSMPETQEYLDHKQAIRARLAEVCFDNDSDYYIDIIKQAMAAIGFGAKLALHGYTNTQSKYQARALEKIIKNQTCRERFIQDAWISSFYKEQQEMNQLILAYCRRNGYEEQWQDIDGIYDSAHRIRVDNVIAYLYQQAESKIMRDIHSILTEKPVLQVHDGFYTRNKQNVLMIRERLREHGQYLKIDEREFNAWNLQYDPAHKQLIAQEELAAQNYQPSMPIQVAGSDHNIRQKPRLSSADTSSREVWDGDYSNEIRILEPYNPWSDK